MKKGRVTITLDQAVIDSIDTLVELQKQRTAQSDEMINRSTFIEHAVLAHLEILGLKSV